MELSKKEIDEILLKAPTPPDTDQNKFPEPSKPIIDAPSLPKKNLEEKVEPVKELKKPKKAVKKKEPIKFRFPFKKKTKKVKVKPAKPIKIPKFNFKKKIEEIKPVIPKKTEVIAPIKPIKIEFPFKRKRISKKLLEELEKKKAETRDYVKRKLDALDEREKEVMAGHKHLSRDQHKWKKEEYLIKRKVSLLNAEKNTLEKDFSRRKEHLEKKLPQKKRELKILNEEFRKKNKILEDDKNALIKKEQELLAKEKMFENLEELSEEIEAKGKIVSEKENLIDSKESLVMSREKDVDAKLNSIEKSKINAENEVKRISKRKGVIELDILGLKDELGVLRKEFNVKTKALEDGKKSFAEAKKEIHEKLAVFKKEENKVKKIKEMANLVGIRESLIANKEKEVEKKFVEISGKRAKLEEEVKNLMEREGLLHESIKNLHNQFDIVGKEHTSKKKELETIENSLKNYKEIERRIAEKEELSNVKESLINSREREVEKEFLEISNKKSKLEKDVNILVSNKNALEEDIKKLKFESDVLKTEHSNKSESLNLVKKEILSIEEGNDIRKKELFAKEMELNQEEKIIDAKLKEIEKNKEILLKEEGKVVSKLKKVKEKSDILKANSSILFNLKDEVDVGLVEKEKKLDELKGEWDCMEGVLEKSKEVLFEKNKYIECGLKNFEENIKTLNKIENVKAEISEKENYVKNKIVNLDKRESSVKAKEDRIKKARDLKANIDDLNQKVVILTDIHDSLKKRISDKSQILNRMEKEEANLKIEKDKELSELRSSEEDIVMKELDLIRTENRINDEEIGLEAKEKVFEDKEVLVDEKLKEIGDKGFIEELKKEVSAPIKKSERIVKDTDVHAAIEEARRLIGSNKISEATSLIKEIQKMQRKIKADGAEKRKIDYDVMDLETDIKLACL